MHLLKHGIDIRDSHVQGSVGVVSIEEFLLFLKGEVILVEDSVMERPDVLAHRFRRTGNPKSLPVSQSDPRNELPRKGPPVIVP